MRILVIEDNKVLCNSITSHLIREGYGVDYSLDGEEGLEYAMHQVYDLIVLDRMLPHLDGITLLKRIRKHGIITPVLLVTALGGIDDKVTGLDSGADDYISKPFSMKELLARVRALCRRPVQLQNTDIIEYKDIIFDKSQMNIAGPNCSCSLSKRESHLFEVFLQNPNTLLSRQFIFSKVWEFNSFVEDGNIDNYIRFIRRRLETIGSSQHIRTVRGVGYILEDEDAK